MDQYTLTVEGMSCTGCAERVTNAAKGIDGVHRAAADHEAGTLEVTADEDTEDAVRQAVYEAGYDVPA